MVCDAAGTEMELREYIATQEEELSRILAKIDKVVLVALCAVIAAYKPVSRYKTTDIKGKERLRIELEAAEVLLEALQTNLQALVDHSPQPQLNFSGKVRLFPRINLIRETLLLLVLISVAHTPFIFCA